MSSNSWLVVHSNYRTFSLLFPVFFLLFLLFSLLTTNTEVSLHAISIKQPSQFSSDGARDAHGRVSLDLQAVLVDMEEGVVNQVLQGALREVFDATQLLTDVSGSGNNW